MNFHTLFHAHIFRKNTNGMDQIDCYQNVRIKLIVTPKYRDQNSVFDFIRIKRKKMDKENSSIDFPYLACIKIKLFATSRKQFYLMSS